jgi:hypothetical protein
MNGTGRPIGIARARCGAFRSWRDPIFERHDDYRARGMRFSSSVTGCGRTGNRSAAWGEAFSAWGEPFRSPDWE